MVDFNRVYFLMGVRVGVVGDFKIPQGTEGTVIHRDGSFLWTIRLDDGREVRCKSDRVLPIGYYDENTN